MRSFTGEKDEFINDDLLNVASLGFFLGVDRIFPNIEKLANPLVFSRFVQ